MSKRAVTGLSLSPLRKARTELWPNKSLDEIVNEVGINYQMWYLTECGCYDSISPRIKIYLQNGGFDISRLDYSYSEFQREQRASFRERYSDARINLLPVVSGNPMRDYWEQFGLSRTAFAKALCIQPATLYKLENLQMRSLSGQLMEALEDAGMTIQNIEELNERIEEAYFGQVVNYG